MSPHDERRLRSKRQGLPAGLTFLDVMVAVAIVGGLNDVLSEPEA